MTEVNSAHKSRHTTVQKEKEKSKLIEEIYSVMHDRKMIEILPPHISSRPNQGASLTPGPEEYQKENFHWAKNSSQQEG